MSVQVPNDLTVQGNLVLNSGEVIHDGFLIVRGGTIVGISNVPVPATRHYDARGKFVFPGFIDAHVHTRSNPQEGITATTLAAAAGGTTTVIDMPFDAPSRPVRSLDVLQKKIHDVDHEAIVDVALYGTFAPDGDLSAIAELADAGICGFKVSTIQVDPVRFPRIPDGRLYEAFQEIATHSLPVAAHQENQEIVERATERLRMNARASSQAISHARSRPPVAEAEAAGRLLELAHWTGAHLHMVHGTIPRTFDLINWNRSAGTAASGETCIQYLTLTENDLKRLGGRAKCNPPLRTGEDVAALWEQLENGLIDIVTSDHSPYPLESKETDSIFEALAGLPGAETLGVLLYSEAVAKGRLSLGTFVRALSSGPARIFGLEKKGRLQVGYDADLAILDPVQSHVLDEQAMHYGVRWSPYHGWKLQGAIAAAFVRGREVYSEGRIVSAPGDGRFVSPSSQTKKAKQDDQAGKGDTHHAE